MATAKAKFKAGDSVVFKGYSEDVPETEQVLTENETYPVVEVNAKEGSLAVEIDNPDFNPKKKESEANSKTIIVDVFFDEVEMAADEADAEEEAPAPKAKAAAKPAAKQATVAKGKAKAAPAEEPEADEEEAEETPAPKAKGKTVAKAAAKPVAKGKTAAKGKAVAKPKAEKAEPEDPYAALESEDGEILALIDGVDLLELAEELVEEGAALDYKLGGVLYHVRLDKAYEELDERYAENGGFGLYVKEKLNVDYRKAMYLIDIYYKFNLFDIDAAKVQELGWTKCSKIAAVMTAENSEELVELAEGSSVSDLTDTIKESYKSVGATAGEKRKKITFKFRLWEDQASAVEETIKGAAESLGLKNLDDAFEHIVMEWAAEHGIEVEPAPKAKAAAKAPAKAGKVSARA